MTIDRRHFLKTGLFFGAGLTLGGLSPFTARADGIFPWNAPPYGRPVIQLFTDETSAQFRVLQNPLQPISYEATTSDGKALPLTLVSTVTNPFDERIALDHLLVEGLRLGQDYILSAYDDRTGARVEERIFSALDTRNKSARIAVASCLCDVFDQAQSDMWKRVAETKPDVIFIIGDTSYTDLGSDGTLKGHWLRHVQTRLQLDFYKWRRLVPIFATWDDHDFAGNNADKTHPLAGKTKGVFKSFFGWTPRGSAEVGPGVATHVDLFGQRYYLLDDRSFRDPEHTDKGLHWGDTQEQWLMKSLSESKTPAWIMNGGQYFGAYLQKDSFESSHPYQFSRVLKTLSQIEAPIIFGSGDVHFSEIMKIERELLGYETFEVTSSSVHSTISPLINHAYNKRRLMTTWRHNFLIVESGVTGGRVDIRARSYGAGNDMYFDFRGNVSRGTRA